MKWFALVFLMIPLMVIFIYGIIKPKESLMFGWRRQLNFMFGQSWRSNDELEPTEFAVDMHRLSCIIGLIVTLIASVGILLMQ